ncbi:MAG: carbamoyltransferase HypF [Candidatus Odinarchaeia archaeon]
MGYKLIVSGIVQGVGFRPFIFRLAKAMNLSGYVKNLGDAGVEIYLQSPKKQVYTFIEKMKEKKPPLAVIETVKIHDYKYKEELNDFCILKSSTILSDQNSIIPPDVAICDDCIRELFDEKNRRYGYFFITCTNCGPRFSTIIGLPYDRDKTTLNEFPMCEKCKAEYTDPMNRRFHAQTIACPTCGPKMYLVDNKGELITEEKTIEESVKLIEEGYIIGIKGNSGFHFATSTLNSEPIIRLRKKKNRPSKPFAVMAPDLNTIKKFAEVSEDEGNLLTSYIRPIVILNKSENYELSEWVAPKLHNIGVMLPYTGLHYLLFKKTKEPAFIMTSANPQDEPITISNEDAINKLGKYVDYFILHNRKINQRSDDSVVRFHGSTPLLIRRSRGYVPRPIELDWLKENNKIILGCGGEENVTFSILKGKKIFLSQYIGKAQKFETFRYYKDTLNYFKHILHVDFEYIVCDLHRGFNTSIYAEKLANNTNIPLTKIQHHYAHLAGLMGENDLKPMIGIIVDGFGLGEDGKPWGGEIITFNSNKFIRVGGIQEFLIPGGDLATIFPLRIAMGFVYNLPGYDKWISKQIKHFPYGDKEVKLVEKLIAEKKTLTSSAAGRFLDSISAMLGVAYKRTYDGEPAIKLESAGYNGKDVLNFEPIITNNKLNVSKIAEEIFLSRDKYSIKDLSFSAMIYLAKGLSELAINAAQQQSIADIGISGGVAYNEVITNKIREIVTDAGFNLIEHKLVPAGDGGLSYGQIIAEILLNHQNLVG